MQLRKRMDSRRWWVGVAALWTVQAACMLVCIVRRLPYPYPLEWMEGNQWYGAVRAAAGQAIYGDPNQTGYLPHPYPPLELWCAGAAIRVFGPHLWAARLVSVAATAITVACLGWAVRRRTQDRLAAWVACCMFLGLYAVLDTWYDLIRVDMPYVALLLLAFAQWAVRPESLWRAAAAFGLLALASLAKQPAVVVLLITAGWWLTQGRPTGRRVAVALVPLGCVAALHAAVNAASGGWYRLFAWELPRHHRFVPQVLFVSGLARGAWVGGLPLVLLWLAASRTNGRRIAGSGLRAARERIAATAGVLGPVWSAALVSTFVACAMTYAKVGATINNWIPFAAVACVAAGVGMARMRRSATGAATGALLLALQLALSVRDPRRLVPSPEDRQAGDRVVELVRAIPGDVYVMDDAYLAVRAGKTPYVGGMTLSDLAYAGRPAPSELLRRLQAREWSAVVLRFDASEPRHTQPAAAAIRAAYTGPKVAIPYASEQTFLPVAGGRYKPRWILYAPEMQVPQ